MISSLFLSPWWLALAIPLTGLLLYVYQRSRSKIRHVVSTLLILKDFHKQSSDASKIKSPPRLLIEVLLSLLLLLVLSQIQIPHKGERIAVVVDASLSSASQSHLVDQSIFDREKAKAQSILDDVSMLNRVSLYDGVSFKPYILDGSVSEAKNTLQTMPRVRDADHLAEYLNHIATNGFDKILVFTDKKILSSSSNNTVELFSVQSDLKTQNNIAMSTLHVDAAHRQIQGSLVSYSDSICSGKILLGKSTIDIDVQAGEHKEFLLPFVSANQNSIVSFIPNKECEDANREDNFQRIDAEDNSIQKGLIASNLSASQLGLEKLGSEKYEIIPPDQLLQKPELASNRTVIFHRVSPPQGIKGNMVLILPPESILDRPKGNFTDLTLTRWEESHPITQYLHLDLLPLGEGETFDALPWQHPVISTNRGPIIVSGEKDGSRIIICGIELFPFRGSESPVQSILTLNILKWVSASEEVVNDISSESDLSNNILQADSLHTESTKNLTEESSNLIRFLIGAILLFLIIDFVSLVVRRRVILGAS